METAKLNLLLVDLLIILWKSKDGGWSPVLIFCIMSFAFCLFSHHINKHETIWKPFWMYISVSIRKQFSALSHLHGKI